MTYDEALAFWFGRVNYESAVPQLDDLKLDRMRHLLARLGNPQDRLRIIHVAGSKGKGSTSAMLANILQLAGYRTGLFTSPHLTQVEERIQIDRQPISPPELTVRLNEIRRVIEDPSHGPRIEPTFFEVATALGFLHFANQEVDAAVIEVGLGGRFDSTNVCWPLVAIITSISFDHVELLGHHLASIAMEKAGIVKPGCPTVSGATAPEARRTIEAICRRRGSPLKQLEKDFHFQYESGQVVPCEDSSETPSRSEFLFQKPRVRIASDQNIWPSMNLALMGEHQAANAAVAVSCVEQLREQGLPIADTAVARGLANVAWPARLEVFGGRPLVVLDCAHNLASIHALIDTLQQSFPPSRRWLIFAGSSDKDLSGMLQLLAPVFSGAFLTRYSGSKRALPPEQLAPLAASHGLPCTVYSSPQEAWHAARRSAAVTDLICITGSVFLAGEIRPLLLIQEE
jgi:dihydrofolate synthase/folylpolyglutamate synthase